MVSILIILGVIAAIVAVGALEYFVLRRISRRKKRKYAELQAETGEARNGGGLSQGFVAAVMLFNVVLVFGGVFGFGAMRSVMIAKFMATMGKDAQVISTAVASTDKWNDSLEVVGSLRAVKGVDLSSEVAGMVDELHFESGDTVKEGDLLVRLRAADDIAKLNSLQATVTLAQANYKRDLVQLKTQAVSQATVDTDSANLDIAKAQVAEQQALLDKKFIHAPFSGVLGVRAVDLGQYLSPGTAIVTLQQIDPIYFDFYLPQQSLSQISAGQKLTLRNDTYPDLSFEGEISAISPKVDTATRNVQVRATLKNPDHKLTPGMYATAKIVVGQPQQYITLPQTSVTYNPFGSTIFLVNTEEVPATPAEEKKFSLHKISFGLLGSEEPPAPKVPPVMTVKQSFVTLGPTRGDQVAVLKGVKEGDTVVTSGQNKLHNGSTVAVNNSITPTSDASPKPQEQ